MMLALSQFKFEYLDWSLTLQCTKCSGTYSVPGPVGTEKALLDFLGWVLNHQVCYPVTNARVSQNLSEATALIAKGLGPYQTVAGFIAAGRAAGQDAFGVANDPEWPGVGQVALRPKPTKPDCMDCDCHGAKHSDIDGSCDGGGGDPLCGCQKYVAPPCECGCAFEGHDEDGCANNCAATLTGCTCEQRGIFSHHKCLKYEPDYDPYEGSFREAADNEGARIASESHDD